MNVYLSNFALMALGYFIWVFTKKFKNGRLYFCVQATIQWILVSGLRSTRVGADTQRYHGIFESVKNTDWSEIADSFKYWLLGSETVKDPGYTVLQKIFQYFSTDYQVFLVFVAICFMVPLGIWIYRNSTDPFFSFALFSALFYSFFAITGIRQTLVTGIVVFLGDELLKKKKYVPFFIILLIMIPVHRSAIALVILPLLMNLPQNAMVRVGTVVLAIAAYFFRQPFLTLISGIVGYDAYDSYIEGAGATTFTLLYYALFLLALVLYDSALGGVKYGRRIMNFITVGAILLPLVSINPSAMRAVQYFSVFLMLLIPHVLDTIEKKETRTYVGIIFIVVLVALMVKNSPTYTFFWQI